MIAVVRDSISGLTPWSKKCFSESYNSILSILKEVRERFGNPSGIISALDEAFSNIPKRVCLFYFLRDPGSDLMKSTDLDLRRRINGKGIKSHLKRLLRSMP